MTSECTFTLSKKTQNIFFRLESPFKDVCNSSRCELDSLNRFNALTNYEDEETHPDGINYKNRTERANKSKGNINGTIKNKMYVNRFPERDIMLRKITSDKVLHSDYGKKIKTANIIVIVSDSITKRVNMIKFNDTLRNGNAVKRVFPGSTASQLNHYVHASFEDNKPTTVIICARSNNFTKKKQSTEGITKEIISIAETCCSGGVKNIFISSLTCRQSYQREINEVNKLLVYYAGIYNYTYIDNSCIRNEHLWKDGLHLNNEGISILAENYIT